MSTLRPSYRSRRFTSLGSESGGLFALHGQVASNAKSPGRSPSPSSSRWSRLGLGRATLRMNENAEPDLLNERVCAKAYSSESRSRSFEAFRSSCGF